MSRRNSDESGRETHLLLDDEDTALKGENRETRATREQSRSDFLRYRHSVALVLHLCLIAINVIWFATNLRHRPSPYSIQGTIYGRLWASLPPETQFEHTYLL